MVAFFHEQQHKKGSSLQTSRAGWGCPVKQNHTLYTILLLENFALKPKYKHWKKIAMLKLQHTSHQLKDGLYGRCQVLELIQVHFISSFLPAQVRCCKEWCSKGRLLYCDCYVTSFQCTRKQEGRVILQHLASAQVEKCKPRTFRSFRKYLLRFKERCNIFRGCSHCCAW